MSPASAGALEVEKYIGSYLISSTARSKNGSKNGTSGCKHSNNNFNRDNHSIGSGAHHSSHRQNNVFNGNILLAEFPSQGYGSPLGNGGGTPDVWAGGLPLISMANHQRRNCGAKKNHNPLVRVADYRHQPSQFARLAIHTHGAPLILTGRHANNGNRGNKTTPGANYQKQHQQPSVQQHQQVRNFAMNENDSKSVLGDNGSKDSASDRSKDSATVSNIDCMSVASDESSGSNNSENCLPRIIKPRKRRKKDRKPNAVNNNNSPNNTVELAEVPGDLKRTDNGNNSTSQCNNVNNSSDNNSNIVTLKPYMPFSYEKYENRQNNTQRNNRYNTNYFNNKVNCDRTNAPVNDFNRFRISDSSNNNNNVEIPDVPKLTHNFEDIKVCDEASSANTSYQVQLQCESVTCQCKYCDPSGLNIWNTDKNGGFSPFAPHFESFFTSPNSANSTSDLFTSAGERDDEFSSNENAADRASSAALRRSWSDPVSSFSPSVASDYSSSSSTAGSDISSCKVGVIGAGRQGREWHGVPPDCNISRCSSSISSSISSGNFEMFPLLNTSSQVLDISTEIVTSLNGHRDLEIKFFSSSSAALSPVEEKSFSTTGFEARVLFSVNSSSGFGDIANGNLVKSGGGMGGDGDQLLWDNAEKDCDITYDTTDISRLLLEAEE